MKKIYLTLSGVILGAAMFAQAPLSTSAFKEAPKKNQDRTIRQLEANTSNRSTIVNQKVNFIDLTANYYSSTPDYDLYYMFPDSTPNAFYGATLGNPFVMSMGMTFDLSSEVINNGVLSAQDAFDPAMNATLDSIAVFCNYEKGRAGYVDTVIYRVITPSATNLDGINYFIGQAADYPLSNDTTRFYRLRNWTGSTPTPRPGVVAEYKVPLLVEDTVPNGLNYPVAVTGGLNVPGIFAITVDYKPGGAYTPYVDTMGERIGSFSVYTAEHNGDGTYSNYVPGDYTGSSWVNNTSFYNSTSGWAGRYIPYLAYGPAIFESLDMDIVLSQTNSISVNEIESEAKLFQNYPNPANENTIIKYSLENNAEVSFELIDITGKKVFSSYEGNKNAGTYTMEVNASELNAGLYFYSIIVNGNRITKKMTVTK